MISSDAIDIPEQVVEKPRPPRVGLTLLLLISAVCAIAVMVDVIQDMRAESRDREVCVKLASRGKPQRDESLFQTCLKSAAEIRERIKPDINKCTAKAEASGKWNKTVFHNCMKTPEPYRW